MLVFGILSFFVPESPRFLVDNQDYSKARLIIHQMSKMNRADLHLKDWKFEEQLQSKLSNPVPAEVAEETESGLLKVPLTGSPKLEKPQKSFSSNPILQMRKRPQLFFNLIISTICWMACSFNYFLISYDVKNLGGDVFLNLSLVAIASVAGKLVTLFGRRFVSTQIAMMGWFLTCLVFGLGLVFFTTGWLVSLSIVFVLMGVGGGFTLSYFLNNEIFNPLFIGFAFSVTQFGSRGITILSYLMADLHEPIPMVLLWVTTGIALVALVFLRKPKEGSKGEW